MFKLLFYLLSFFVVLSFLALSVTHVYAITDPDSITIESVRVYEGLWETGDMLFVVEYKVMYASGPSERPEDTFLVGLWDGAVKGPDRPLGAYDHNITSVYLTAAQVASWGYLFEDELVVRVLGNPVYFSTLVEGTNMSTFVLGPSYWFNGGSLSITRSYLANWSIVLAEVLEDSWSETLLTTSDRLNATGSVTFREAIPGLEGVCPDIFQVSISYPDYTTPSYNATYQTKLSSNMGSRLETALDGLGEWMVGKSGMGAVIGALGLSVLYFILAGKIFVATGSVSTSIAVSLPFLFVGNYIGVLSLAVTYIAAFLVALGFAVTFILARF